MDFRRVRAALLVGFVVCVGFVRPGSTLRAQDGEPHRVAHEDTLDIQRALDESQAGITMREQLRVAFEAYQARIDCVQARLRSEPDEGRRRRLASYLGAIFVTMRELLRTAERERVEALVTCARRHVAALPEGEPEPLERVIAAMTQAGCSNELGPISPLPMPPDSGTAECDAR